VGTSFPAPLSARDLDVVLVDDLAAARTLPAEAYNSTEVFNWEARQLFGGGWVCIGRSELVPEPGSQRGMLVGETGVLLVRDADRRVRAFHNTCRHRGHELVSIGECRRRRAIACPYHAWVYALDGQLQRASRFTDLSAFETADFPLLPVRVEEWLGWIFINVSGDAPELSEWTGSLAGYLADWEPERLVVGASHEYVIQANWKIIFENFVECYHCPSIHPELCRVSDPESGTSMFPHDGMWMGGPMELINGAETQSLDGKGSGVRFRRLSGRDLDRVHYHTLFPNLLISPHPDYLMTHTIVPRGPAETFVECAWLFPPEATAQQGFDPSFAAEFWDRTNGQDFAACESVTRGLRSAGYRPGPFDQREAVVHAFQTMIARAYMTGALAPPVIVADARSTA
jgi:Rieske 2Fe-2S family protein